MRFFNKKIIALIAITAVISGIAPQTVKANQTQVSDPETVHVGIIKEGDRSTDFNKNWTFFKGNVEGAEEVEFNDSSWRKLNLPHDWSIEGEFTTQGEAESGFLEGGTGWYRKTFVVPENYNGKDFTLNFDGVYMNSEIYVNGIRVGEHNYGYTAFAFDISDALICDGETENIIAIKVSNNIPTSRWYSGSGIYRDVTLSITEQIHVDHLGTTVVTPNLETQKEGNVDVNLNTVVFNESEKDASVTVKSTIIDSEGNSVSKSVENTIEIAANSKVDVDQVAIVNSPNLWSVNTPNLYKSKTEVIVDNKVVDTYYTEFGFRYYEFDRETGFTLNGEMMKLQGVCMHHDQGSLGSAAYYDAIERQMIIMKEMGVNAIRVSHNPASESLLEICNRLGLLVINEAFDTWTNSKNGNYNDFSKYFNTKITEDNTILNAEEGMTWGEFEAKAMVKNSKNNPSVIMWSIGNEVLEGIGGDASNYPEIAQNIIDWIKEEDTTRPVTIGDNRSKGGQQLAIDISNVIAENDGIVGFNYTDMNQFNSMLNNNENWIAYDSETSSAVHSRGHYETIGRDNNKLQMAEYDNEHNKVGWGASANEALKRVIQNDRNAGQFVWTGFDYIGEPTPWNGVGTGSVSGQGAAPKSTFFGIVDTAGFEKDIYYLYQSQWNDDVNTLHLLPTWNGEDIYLNNGNATVQVFTDADKVELYLNGEKIDEATSVEHTTEAGYKYKAFGNDLYPTFQVPYEDGTLEVKAFDKKGNEITETEGRNIVKTYGEVDTVKLSADKETINSNGYDLSYVTIDLVDEDGNFVSSADTELTYTLEGNGNIVGLDNGNAADTDSYKPENGKQGQRDAFNGKALVILQSTKDAGEMVLTVSGEGIKSQSITINTEHDQSEEKYLESYEISKDYYVNLGVKPNLPEKIEGRYSDGSVEEFNIVWNSYDEENLNTPQIFKANGTLEGTDISVSVNIHVIGEIGVMENYSTFTYAGTSPKLPKTVKGYLVNGEQSEDFSVKWEIDQNSFNEVGEVVVVKGNVTLLGKEYPVTANVRVVEPLKDSANIAINSSENKDIPTILESCQNKADNLNSINNGINNSTSPSERWTNWGERDEVVDGEPKGAYVQFNWNNKYDIKKLDLWLFADSGAGKLPQKVEISYKNAEGEYVVAPHSNTTEVEYTSGETTYLLDDVVNTDSIRIYMQQNAVGNCIGLAEVNIYEYVEVEALKENNKLSEIKLDGVQLEGFDSNKNEYTVEVDNLPEIIEATSEENAAITILPIYNNESKIIVKSENGKINVYTIIYEVTEKVVNDINKDGVIDIKDLAIVSRYYGEIIDGNELSENSDLNNDNIIDEEDINIISKEILKNKN